MSAANGLLAVSCLGDHALRSVEAGAAGYQLDVFALQSLSDVAGLSFRKIKNALVHRGQVYAYAGVDVALINEGRTAARGRVDWRTSVITSAVAIKVFEGTQSVRTAEPPSPSLSTKVISPPSLLPTSAAS